ncbi:MAG TPA: HAD family hydrolase [Polyangia bacterium]|jgi:putative hydrolase of the HAD superfamily|nr:HAD family hydrolase [Polyangia bacterium]
MSASYHEARTLSDPRPRAILVDVGFTLTFWDGARIAAHAAAAGVRVEPAAIERAEMLIRTETREIEGQPLRTHDDGGKRYLDRVFARALRLAGAAADDATIERAAAYIHEQHLRRNVWRRVGAGNPAALERLRAAGFRLAIVSNSEGTIDAMLTEVGLKPYFETIIDSAIVGSVKPDPRIFQIALERLDVPPSDAVMIGDLPTADVFGPRVLGIRAALVDPHDIHAWVPAPRFKDFAAFTDAMVRAAG